MQLFLQLTKHEFQTGKSNKIDRRLKDFIATN